MNAIEARRTDAFSERSISETSPEPAGRFDLDRAAQLHGESLFRLAMRLSGSRDTAWDLLHDTYERALRCGPAGVPDDEARAWLTVVMRNLFYDRWRSRQRHLEVEFDAELRAMAPAEAEEEPEWASISVDQVRHCLAALEAPLRTVYEMHTFAGLSYNEISSSLRLPSRTVGTRLFRARRKLREALSAGMGV